MSSTLFNSIHDYSDWSLNDDDEVLYRSAWTVIIRHRLSDGRPHVDKWAFGAGSTARLEHERDMLSRLQGIAGVVQLEHGLQEQESLVLEDSRGVVLNEWLSGAGKSLKRKLKVAVRLARILSDVHRSGVLHRDINPCNILIRDPDDSVVLIDFDLACLLSEVCSDGTSSRELVGTLAYLSPEQSGRTGSVLDQRSDLYALGATLYEMFCARPPFVETDALRLIHSHLAQLPTAPDLLNPQLPTALSRIVMRLLEKAPEYRYQSADGLAYDLQRLVDAPCSAMNEDFVLGNHDFGVRIDSPAKPVGRKAEVTKIQAVFSAALAGEGSVLLMSGVSGVGKTRLIDDLRPLIALRNGYYVTGRHEQQDLEIDASLSPFISLARQLLAEPEAELNQLRDQLIETLGQNAALLATVNADFATLLQIDVEQTLATGPRLDGRQLLQGCTDMLRIVCAAARPIVLVLDNLHWGSPASITLVDNLVSGEPIAGFLLIAVYCDNEVDAAHPLSIMQSRWVQRSLSPPQIHLENLHGEDLTQLLGDMLNLPAVAASQLAEVLLPYTLGNPFDTVEFVNVLFRQSLLVDDDGWHWDIEAIRDAARNSEVMGLVESSLKRLPAATLRLMRLIACLGGDVERELLGIAAAHSASDLEKKLLPALEAGQLITGKTSASSISFRNNRVQQASLEQLTGSSEAKLHLLLARRLASHDRYIEFAAKNYLAASALITTDEERYRAARLLHLAANAPSLLDTIGVERLLGGGVALLENAAENKGVESGLRFDLLCDWHTALCDLGRADDVDRVYARIRNTQVNILRTIDAGCLQIASLTNRGRAADAVALGLELLGSLGVTVPDQQSIRKVICRALPDFDAWSRDSQRKTDFDRMSMSDPMLIGASRVIMRLMAPSFFAAPDLMAWLCIESRRLWSEHGPSDALIGPLAHCIPVLLRNGHPIGVGHRVVGHVLEVAEVREFVLEVAQARYLFALTAGHWLQSLTRNVELARRAHDELVQGGDYQNACFSHFALVSSAMDCAPTLDGHALEIASAVAFAKRTGNDMAVSVFSRHEFWADALRGKRPLPRSLSAADANETISEPSSANGNVLDLVNQHLLQAHLALIFDVPEMLGRSSAVAMRLLRYISGSQLSVLGYVVRACYLARQGAEQTPENDCLHREFATCRRWLVERSAEAPENFEHLVHLIDAEAAWKRDDYQGAAQAFDKARSLASLAPRPWHQAFIAERSALFQASYGLTGVSRDLLTEAYDNYNAWGAQRKVQQLEEAHIWLCDKGKISSRPSAKSSELLHNVISTMKSGSSIGSSVDAIDLVGILKASQALSSETSLDPLKLRITEVLEALSGATSVSIILWHVDEQMWRLLAPTGSQEEESLSIEEAGERGLLPLSAFRYFERTREMLLVDDATCDERFSRDPYMSELQHCSLMLMPLFSNGTARAVLMLENRLCSSAFVADRLEAVTLVAGQLTVSLDNALLYASLERKVAERTEALAEANERLESLSVTDSLTGIANRRRFDQVLETECLRAQSKGSSIGFALIDIDEFKRYNDNYGHLYGDDALREVASALRLSARTDDDLVARYGGEEFVVVLPDTDMNGTLHVAERMRAAVEKLQMIHEFSDHGRLTISVGVTAFVPSAETDMEAEVTLADKALYLAKNRGRNCVVASDDNWDITASRRASN